MAKTTDPDFETAAIDAALELFAEQGYRPVRLVDIAAKAGCDLGELRRRFDGKPAILGRFLVNIDAAVLGDDPDFGEEESIRDRLFDLLMRRFDALQPYRQALSALRRDLRGDLPVLLSLAPQGLRALGWYLEAAGESADGMAGALRVKGLAMVWLHCATVWLEDDTEDLSKTMAALDKALAQAERAAAWLPNLSLPRDRAPGDHAPGDRAEGRENGAQN